MFLSSYSVRWYLQDLSLTFSVSVSVSLSRSFSSRVGSRPHSSFVTDDSKKLVVGSPDKGGSGGRFEDEEKLSVCL